MIYTDKLNAVLFLQIYVPWHGIKLQDSCAKILDRLGRKPDLVIGNEVSGFHINPLDGKEASNKIANFFQKCNEDPMYWNRMSTAGLQRIYEW
jgi:hypothetical protein